MIVAANMCTFSINLFIASWLLFCLINPLCNGAENWIPYEPNDSAYQQFQQSEVASDFDEQVKVPESADKSRYHHDHEPNAVQSGISSKNVYPEVVAVKSNAAKSMPEYLLEREQKSRYGFSGRRHVENQEESFEKQSNVLWQRQEEGRRKDEEIMKKINALDKYLSDDSDENNVESRNTIEDRSIVEGIPEETKRVVRQVSRQRPGFFWTLARLAFETFNDTRSAIQQIGNIINENFEPDTSTRRPVTSGSFMVTDATTIVSSNDQSNMPSNVAGVNVITTTTKQPPARLSRTGLQNLIRRNLRGLVRLFNIEWQDALNQSEINVREFQRNLGNQVGSFLRDNPNAY